MGGRNEIRRQEKETKCDRKERRLAERRRGEGEDYILSIKPFYCIVRNMSVI